MEAEGLSDSAQCRHRTHAPEASATRSSARAASGRLVTEEVVHVLLYLRTVKKPHIWTVATSVGRQSGAASWTGSGHHPAARQEGPTAEAGEEGEG